MDEEFFDDLRERVKTNFEDGAGHGFDHTERVYDNVIIISEDEDVDLDVVRAAALLHDIARKKEEENKDICHAEEGAKMAQDFLEELDFPEDKIKNVVHSIRVHRYSKGLNPETKEAEILQDADRLDALGAVAIARVFSKAGFSKIPLYDFNVKPDKEYHGQDASNALNHFYEKILKIKPETFHTKKAQELAESRYKFVENFLDRFVEECGGEK